MTGSFKLETISKTEHKYLYALAGIKARKEVKLVSELPMNCPMLYNSLFTVSAVMSAVS